MITRQLKSVARSALNRITGRVPASSGITILESSSSIEQKSLTTGWQDSEIAQRQHDAFRAVLADMHAGRVREDFAALVAAMKEVPENNPSVIEVGAGSGWNSEVLARLLGRPIDYIGLDYSESMMRLGRRCYPQLPFIVGDASLLPLADACCSVLISGTVLMHVLRYDDAIRESRRVSRRWCIFHTIPVLQHRDTIVLQKKAYGVPVVEIVFNEDGLKRTFETCGLRCIQSFESIPHHYLDGVAGEPVSARTYLCEIA
jgi:ubiquinone/menaquinone biosynthesis C-methylase UbiE